jgi:hypothetical protein
MSCIVTPSLLPRSLFHPTVNHSAITANRFDSDGTSDYFEYWQVSNYWLVLLQSLFARASYVDLPFLLFSGMSVCAE